jgi:hypothetical protein
MIVVGPIALSPTISPVWAVQYIPFVLGAEVLHINLLSTADSYHGVESSCRHGSQPKGTEFKKNSHKDLGCIPISATIAPVSYC